MSNFYPFKLIYNGIEYQNTETAFSSICIIIEVQSEWGEIMSLFLQIMISTWIISTISVIISYSASVSNKNFTGLVNAINTSETLNLFGKIFLNLLYLFLCPLIATIEWLITAMTYHNKN